MIELGLTRVHRLLARTSLPWRAIHVAGTNGKGSVCAYASAMLQAYNSSDLIRYTRHKPIAHARFTSPHLVDRWDSITVNDVAVSKTLFDEVEERVMTRNRNEAIGASEFELLTATAFEIFTRSKVDIGVVEVGMGGRLDATNVIGQMPPPEVLDESFLLSADYRPPPLVIGITSIGLDHQGFLGDTLPAIAREKCGIIKAGVPVVAAKQDHDSIDEVITRSADSRGASGLAFVSPNTTVADIWCQDEGTTLADQSQSNKPVQSRWANGALALQLVWKSLQSLGRLVDAPAEMRQATLKDLSLIPERTQWRGRLQQTDLAPVTGIEVPTIIDGSHNAQSAAMLRSFLDNLADQRSVEWIIAASKGKDMDEMLRILLRPGDVVNAMEFGPVDGMPWVAPLDSNVIMSKATEIVGGEHMSFGTDLRRALQEAAASAARDHRRLVVAGSLYLVGDVFRLMRDKQ